MQFRLYYRGPLKANGGPKEKQQLRKKFHFQLEDLWNRWPLSGVAEDCLNLDSNSNVIKEVGDWKFSSVVNAKYSLVTELEITILRPEDPGSVITQGGDLDNRLKTLLDALSIPPHCDQIPKNDSQSEDETPLHCLLEDDNLVTGLSVSADRLLYSQNSSEVVLMIRVDVSGTKVTRGNFALIG